jgi:serine phosphatase RsbU (regulator of sigma subunit)/anti-sigma regulatory factor (Ser/Thr protein kinase)
VSAAPRGAHGRPRVVSIRLIATWTTVALIAASVVSVGAVSERNMRRALTREIETRLVLEARNLALTSAGALLSEFPELTLVPLVNKMQGERRELEFVVVVDHRGRIQGSADARRLGEPFSPPQGLKPEASDMVLQPGETLLGSADLLVVEAPVSHPSEPHLGRAVVAVQRSYIEASVSAARREQLLYLVGLLAIGATLGLVLLSRLLRPIGALREGLERVGRGEFDTPLQVHDRTELGILAEEVNEMAARLKVARAETVERERLAREVELAREIQTRLLPHGRRVAGDHVLFGSHRAAAEVGGDYYDFLELPDGRVAIAIADVAGKGLGGCLVMSMLSSLLRALYAAHPSPKALLVELQKHLLQTLKPGEFVTMFYGILEPDTGRLTYASAGHSPVMLWRAHDGNVEWHSSEGIPLGALRGDALDSTLADRTVELAPGDLLLQFTDGYNEAFDTAGREQFGFDGIEEVVRSHAGQGADALVRALGQAMAEWNLGEPLDDETLLVVSREGARAQAEPAASNVIPLPVSARAVASVTAGDGNGLAARAASAEPAATGPLEHDARDDHAFDDSAPSADWPADSLADAEPLARLRHAEAHGVKLTLPASLEALGILAPWIDRCPHLRDLPAADRRRLETALYEAAANVVEHGLQLEAGESFDLWWVPRPSDPAAARTAEERVHRGYFVMRDAGFPFSPGRWQPQDLRDPQRRLYGRGLGLDLIHIAMDEVVYRPATPAGNLTFLSFDPAKEAAQPKEDPHV